MEQYPEVERLTLKLWETPLGFWAYGVYAGDGTAAGSLKAASGGMNEPETALEKGLADLRRQIVIRACEHDWQPWLPNSDLNRCSKCGIVNLG